MSQESNAQGVMDSDIHANLNTVTLITDNTHSDQSFQSGHESNALSIRQAPRPFDKRFETPLSESQTASPSNDKHSAHGSFTEAEPWEVIRWTRLRKISDQVFSENGRRNYGRPTCIAVSAVIAIGTSRGLILVFDYHQNLKAALGTGTRACECGSVTAVALSADHSTVAGGHSDGDIFTWEISRPTKPFLHFACSPVSNSAVPEQYEGHMHGVTILHVEFLGTRHTALVSADDKGMAFSHLASRGLGALSRVVRTTRILGRYSGSQTTQSASRKPSSVLAFSSMPLGNMESGLDKLGLVAILTPYLLVVVSTTPVAQTQHKITRPKNIAPHGALSAALAWYPPMELSAPSGVQHANTAKLAYSWLNSVSIIDMVEVEAFDSPTKDSPPELDFRLSKTWQASESIVAMQWMSHSVLALVTITQQLLVLDTTSMHVTDSTDLLTKHMYHIDAYSGHLAPIVESLDQGNVSMHGVVADAFHMSFKAYKGRVFLLSYQDICIGTLSNWADRLLALMEQGDFIAAITLATSYYELDHEHAGLGLPDDKQVLRAMVGDRLVQMISASLEYTFNQKLHTQNLSQHELQSLVGACFKACLAMETPDLLFDEVFTHYSEGEQEGVFFAVLQQYIEDGVIKEVPPTVLKQMVNAFVNQERAASLETLLCRLDPITMDLDQVTSLCQKYGLYDALLYIWCQAIGDYTTVLEMLLKIADDTSSSEAVSKRKSAVDKIFPYLSHVLTGRVYPTGRIMPDDQAIEAKCDVYFFIFASADASEQQTEFQRLRGLLSLEPLSFFAMLNEAFEDSFLNDADDEAVAGRSSESQRFGFSLTRQYITRILLQLSVEPGYPPKDSIYLDMFVARSVAKFPQHLLLPGGVLQRILARLCDYPDESFADECQLSVEYLLSAYQPPDTLSLVPMLSEARFHRVVKSIYRSEKQYPRLLQASLSDTSDISYVFHCIRECLGPLSLLGEHDRRQFESVIVENITHLVGHDLVETARTIDACAPHLLPTIVEKLGVDESTQYAYLRELLDSAALVLPAASHQSHLHRSFIELYVRLLCEFDPHHISTFIERIQVTDLNLGAVIPAMEKSGAVDAAIILMARSSQIRLALDRLLQHISHLQDAFLGIVGIATEEPGYEDAYATSISLLDSLERYVGIGVWLCQRQYRNYSSRENTADRLDNAVQGLVFGEQLWLELIDVVVQIVRGIDDVLDEGTFNSHQLKGLAAAQTFRTRVKGLVHRTFTSLLTVTSSDDNCGKRHQMDSSFLRILNAFLSRASAASTSIAQLRDVLSTIFSAYTYQEELLGLAYKMLDSDLYLQVEEVSSRRKKGWRPLGQACGDCGVRVWGPGLGPSAWDSWLDRAQEQSRGVAPSSPDGRPTLDTYNSHEIKRGKATRTPREDDTEDNEVLEVPRSFGDRNTPNDVHDQDALVAFSCRHIFHQKCLHEAWARVTQLPESDDIAEKLSNIDIIKFTCPLEIINKK